MEPKLHMCFSHYLEVKNIAPPKFNSSPLTKMVGKEADPFLSAFGNFSGANC